MKAKKRKAPACSYTPLTLKQVIPVLRKYGRNLFHRQGLKLRQIYVEDFSAGVTVKFYFGPLTHNGIDLMKRIGKELHAWLIRVGRDVPELKGTGAITSVSGRGSGSSCGFSIKLFNDPAAEQPDDSKITIKKKKQAPSISLEELTELFEACPSKI